MKDNFVIDNTLTTLATSHILECMPCPIAIKNSASVYVAANIHAAKLAGFSNTRQMIGLRDAELKCDAADLYELFVSQDQNVLTTGIAQVNLDIAEYSDGELHCFLSTKKQISDNDNNTFVLLSMNEVPIHSLSRVFTELNKSHGPSIKKLHSSYLIDNAHVASNSRERIQITRRQAECLFYLLQSKTTKEIAFLLNRSQRTIEDHITRLKWMFNAESKSSLIETAYELGYAQIIPPSLLSMAK